MTNGGDGALLEMSTQDVFSRSILLGPYSRFLFFHPGPMYFLLRYPVYMLSGCRNSSNLLTTVLIVVSCLFGSWHIIRKKLGSSASLIFTVVMALYFLNTDKILWLSEWNPHVIMFPVLLYAISMAAFAARSFRFFYLSVLTGSLAAQTHIGSIPTLLALFLTGLLCAVFLWIVCSSRERLLPVNWKHVLIGTGVLVLFWIPPLYEQFTADDKGNMTVIQEFFEENNPEVSVRRAVNAWSRSLTTLELRPFTHELRESDPSGLVPLSVIAVRLLLLSAGFSLLRRRGNSSFLCALNLIVIAAHGAAYYSISQIRGELNPYLLDWMTVITPLSLFTIAASIAKLFGHAVNSEKIGKYLSFAAMGFLVFAVFSITRDVSGYFRTELDRSLENEIAIDSISSDLAQVMDQDSTVFYVLEMHTWDCWIVMTGLMNTLEKQGYNIVMADNVWFKPTPVPDGYSSRTFHIGYLNETGEAMPGLVSRYDRIGVLLQ